MLPLGAIELPGPVILTMVVLLVGNPWNVTPLKPSTTPTPSGPANSFSTIGQVVDLQAGYRPLLRGQRVDPVAENLRDRPAH